MPTYIVTLFANDGTIIKQWKNAFLGNLSSQNYEHDMFLFFYNDGTGGSSAIRRVMIKGTIIVEQETRIEEGKNAKDWSIHNQPQLP